MSMGLQKRSMLIMLGHYQNVMEETENEIDRDGGGEGIG